MNNQSLGDFARQIVKLHHIFKKSTEKLTGSQETINTYRAIIMHELGSPNVIQMNCFWDSDGWGNTESRILSSILCTQQD